MIIIEVIGLNIMIINCESPKVGQNSNIWFVTKRTCLGVHQSIKPQSISKHFLIDFILFNLYIVHNSNKW
jgi:hypothetical protein